MNGDSRPRDYEPYRVMGDAARDALAAKVRGIFEDFFGEWLRTEEASISVHSMSDFRLHCANAGSGPARMLQSGQQSQGACVFFAADSLLHTILGGASRVAGASGVHSTLASAVQAELVDAICARLSNMLQLLQTPQPATCSLLDCTLDAGMQRWFVCAFGRPGSRIHAALLLHPTTVDRLVPKSTATPQGAERPNSRKAAVGENTVRLEVLLGDADVGYADLTRLAIDDVLVLNQDLTADATLQSSEGAPIASVRVGRVGERLAVHLV